MDPKIELPVSADATTDVDVLDCDFDVGGPWAGLNQLLRGIVPTLQAEVPALVTLHDYELALVVPELRKQITVRNPSLTDTAAGDEAVRNYAMDRAYRIVHGVVDLLAQWRAQLAPGRSWVLECERLDLAGALVRRAIGELVRRKGDELDLRVVATVAPGGEAALGDELTSRIGGRVQLRVASAPASAAVTAAERVYRGTVARALEAELEHDSFNLECRLPELIAAWRGSDTPERARRWYAWALGICNHNGMYADALRYGEEVVAHLDLVADGSEQVRWNVIGNLFHAMVATGDPERARHLIETEALAKLQMPELRLKASYVMGMLHGRFLPARDLEIAERHLSYAIDGVEALELSDDKKHFLAVFFGNGLAFVRQRQGRSAEAIALCRAGAERLDRHLAPTRHRLHRSVLLFNIAQVCSSTRAYEEAVQHLGAAMAIDPNYSEYYNDRGNALLRLGRLEEALADYQQAIVLSPPYAEVQANLGQCLSLLGKSEEAVAAYSRALDLEPGNRLAREGRAQAYDRLGQSDAALGDYGALLRLDPNQPLVLANRAALRFDRGLVDEAIDDLDRAIALVPNSAELYYNRAFALEGGGRAGDAARDLRSYLALAPASEERAAVERRLSALEPAHAP